MHDFIDLNGEVIKPSAASIAALSSAALYGRGAFTTIAIYERLPLLWEKHWLRLTKDSAILGIDTTELSEHFVRGALDQILAANNVIDGRARITIFDVSPSANWPFEARHKSSVLVTTADLQPVQRRLRLGISKFTINSRSPLAGIKSCNYLENLLALEAAKDLGLDEAVRMNERGEVASAAMANVFWFSDGKLYTPELSTGCLAGTTRALVLEKLDYREVVAGIDELRKADEIFLTSAGIGVAQVTEFDGRAMPVKHHSILNLLPSRA